MARKLKVDLHDLADAMHSCFEGTVTFLDTKTGRILVIDQGLLLEDDDGVVAWDEEMLAEASAIREDAEHRYREIEPATGDASSRLMERFITGLSDEDTRRRLAGTMSGPRPFRGFRDALRQIDKAVEQLWYEFEREHYLGEARRWLESLGIEPVAPGKD